MIETAVIGVDLLLVYRDHLLVIKRGKNPFKDQWALPGGAVDKGEPILDALYRETKEETGYDLDTVRYLGYADEPGRDSRGRTVTHVFTPTGIVEEQSLEEFKQHFKAGDDAAEIGFIPIDDVISRKTILAFDHNDIVVDNLQECYIKG